MTPCLFSISYAGLWGQEYLPLPEFIERAGRLGYPAVMLAGKRPHLSPLDANPEAVENIRRALERAGARHVVIAAYTDLAERSGAGCEIPRIEHQIAYVEALCRIASQLGARIVRIFTAYESGGVADSHTAWSAVVRAVREICDRAAPHGVTIAIQNHHDLAVHTDAMLELLAEIGRPNCRLGFDAWSPALRGENLREAAKKAAPHTVLTTNADYIRVPRWRYHPELVNYERLPVEWVRAVPFGSGFIDYEAFFQGLRDGGFEGLAAYEMCSPLRGGGSLANLDACASGYLEWMRGRGLVA